MVVSTLAKAKVAFSLYREQTYHMRIGGCAIGCVIAVLATSGKLSFGSLPSGDSVNARAVK
jgi:hypothetical protein